MKNSKIAIHLFRLILRQILKKRSVLQSLKLYAIVRRGEKKRKKNKDLHQVNIPPICVISVTQNCNIACKGCYSALLKNSTQPSSNSINKRIEEAVQLGSYLFVLTGGEPLLVNDLIGQLNKFTDAIFLVFTNGLCFDSKIIEELKRSKNVIPVISYEGSIVLNNQRRGEGKGEQIEQSLLRLKSQKLLFGFSTMVTHQNVWHVGSEKYFEKMKRAGASFGLFIDYIPIGHKPNPQLLLTSADYQLKQMQLNQRKQDRVFPFFNLPEDEKLFGGCGAAGKMLIHINANGDVEPCMFIPQSRFNINKNSLLEILKSKHFSEYHLISNSQYCNHSCSSQMQVNV